MESAIVVGIDFSEGSAQAARMGLDIARRAGKSLVLAHVGAVPDSVHVPESYRSIRTELQNSLRAMNKKNREQLDALKDELAGQGAEVSIAQIDDYPDQGICKIAKEFSADMIVIGSHGRTGLKRLLLGSVAERVVRLAECSVLVARGEITHGGFKKVLIGADFSEQADRALAGALQVSKPDAELVALHAWNDVVVGPSPYLGGELAMEAGVQKELEDSVATRGATWLRSVDKGERSLRFFSQPGDPKRVLLEALESEEYDCCAVGCHGRRGVRRLILGSVAETVVRHASCSVLVAK